MRMISLIKKRGIYERGNCTAEGTSVNDTFKVEEKAEWRQQNKSWLRHSRRIAVKMLEKIDEQGLPQKQLAEHCSFYSGVCREISYEEFRRSLKEQEL